MFYANKTTWTKNNSHTHFGNWKKLVFLLPLNFDPWQKVFDYFVFFYILVKAIQNIQKMNRFLWWVLVATAARFHSFIHSSTLSNIFTTVMCHSRWVASKRLKWTHCNIKQNEHQKTKEKLYWQKNTSFVMEQLN